MNVDLGIWDKLTKAVLLLVVIGVCVAIGFWYLPLIRQNERMRREIERLQAQIKQEEESSRQFRAQLQSLGSDPRAVERLAREKLGYARTNETIFRFEAPATNAPAPR
ncbi:MAG: septum formation initiator family protein [Verrucomicrobia bacterium]|nr:septum formation initiator family protein [Verrucomicrobiota bacterium]